MKFLFDLVFYSIVFIIIVLLLFYKPVETLIFLAVFFAVCITIGLLLFKYKHRRK